jgi:hypothetical protein
MKRNWICIVALLSWAALQPAEGLARQRPAGTQQLQPARQGNRLQRYLDRKLDNSRFLSSTPFRQQERAVLKGLVHPVRTAKQVAKPVKHGLRQIARGVAWTAKHPCQAAKKTARGIKKGAVWCRKHPKQALMWTAGLGAVVAVAWPGGLATALGSTVEASLLAHGAGATTASIVGTGSGGALASFASSLWAHGLSMVNGQDKVNYRRLLQDATMSGLFGFCGFGVAQAMKGPAQALGLSGPTLLAYNWGGLMGYEMGKDYVQNGVNNLAIRLKLVEDKDGSAKPFKDIWDPTLAMETATNTPRIFGGLSTNFMLKSAIDMGARVAWDRIIHGHPQKPPADTTGDVVVDQATQ